ncbi:putative monocarboxylate transporter mch1 [Tulasnella sp. 403]|nr:putative monocarboxylate transporter mch1 [Tulasnella sp. 403]
MLGLGEVFSYFSVIFTAAKDFPRHNGLATGITLALFGLSPLFLSLPSYLFPTPAGYVNAKAYVIFIGTMTTLMHIVSIYGLLPPPPRPLPTIEQESTAPPEDAMNEESLLLPKPTLPNDRPTEPQTWSTVLGDPYFWWVFAITATTIGSAEMVIGNIGTVVTSLLTVTRGSSQAVSNQVQLLSICNTASRLTSGPLIDLLCPNPLILNRRRVVISRFVFIGLGCLLLAVCYGFMGFFVRSNDQTWLLSGSVGIAYGAIWTVLPGVVKLMWGERNFGRNFGILAYAPFFGTTFWTYVFATNVDRESAPGMLSADEVESGECVVVAVNKSASALHKRSSPYDPIILNSAIYQSTTANSSASSSNHHPAVFRKEHRRVDSDNEPIPPYIPSLNPPTSTKGYTSDSSVRRDVWIPPASSYRRPSNTTRTSPYDSDTGSSARFNTDSTERKIRRDLRAMDPSDRGSDTDRPERRKKEVRKPVDPLADGVEQSSSAGALVRVSPAPTDLVPKGSSPESERYLAPRKYSGSSTAVGLRRDMTPSSSSVEAAKENPRIPVETLSSSTEPPKRRQGSFDGLFVKGSVPPKPKLQSVVEVADRGPTPEPKERSYPSSPPPAPLIMPCTLPERNSVVLEETSSTVPEPRTDVPKEKPVKPKKPELLQKRSIAPPPKVLAITEAGESTPDEESESQSNSHSIWPKYLRLPQSPLSSQERFSTPEPLDWTLGKEDDVILYQPPLPTVVPAVPTLQSAAQGVKSHQRGSSSSLVPKAIRRGSTDSTSSQRNRSPSPLTRTRPHKASSPLAIMAPTEDTSNDTVVAVPVPEPAPPAEVVTPPALAPAPQPASAVPKKPPPIVPDALQKPKPVRKESLKQEESPTSYFDLRSPSLEKLRLHDSGAYTPAPLATKFPDLVESLFASTSPNEDFPPTSLPKVEEPAWMSRSSPPTSIAIPNDSSPNNIPQAVSSIPTPQTTAAHAPSTTLAQPISSSRNVSPTPSIPHRPYLPDYSRHLGHKRSTSQSSTSSPVDSKTSPSTTLVSSSVSSPPTDSPLFTKESRSFVPVLQAADPETIKAPSRPSREQVPPLFPYSAAKESLDQIAKVADPPEESPLQRPNGRSLESNVKGSSLTYSNTRRADSPTESFKVESKTPIADLFKSTSTTDVSRSPPSTDYPAHDIMASFRYPLAEKQDVTKTSAPAPQKVDVQILPVGSASKLSVEDVIEDSTIGQALDMPPLSSNVPHAIDTPSVPPVKQGRHLTTEPTVGSPRQDGILSIRDRHIRKPSLQVEKPDARSISPLNLESTHVPDMSNTSPVATSTSDRPSIPAVAAPPTTTSAPTPAQPPAATGPTTNASSSPTHPPTPDIVLQQPQLPRSPPKDNVLLPSTKSEKKQSTSTNKAPALPLPLSLRRPSMEKVQHGVRSNGTQATSKEQTAPPLSTKDKGASTTTKPSITTPSIPTSSLPPVKPEPPSAPPPRPSTPEIPLVNATHISSRHHTTTKDHDSSPPLISSRNAPLPPTNTEETHRLRPTRSRPHARDAMAVPPSMPTKETSRSAATSNRHAATAHSSRAAASAPSQKSQHSSSAVPTSKPSPPQPSEAALQPAAPSTSPSQGAVPAAAPAQPTSHRERSSSRSAGSSSANAISSGHHRKHRTAASGSAAQQQVVPPVPKIPAHAVATSSPVPTSRHRPASPNNSGSSDMSDAAPAKHHSRRPGLLQQFFKKDMQKVESTSRSKPPVSGHRSAEKDDHHTMYRTTSKQPKPPTTTPPTVPHRSSPSPVPTSTHPEVPSRSAGSNQAAAGALRKPHPKEKGLLSSMNTMFFGNRRARRTVSNASIDAVLGGSNNHPGSPSGPALEAPPSPVPYRDPNVAIYEWQQREAGNRKDGRRHRPGVTWADLNSEPGSPTRP